MVADEGSVRWVLDVELPLVPVTPKTWILLGTALGSAYFSSATKVL